MFKRLQPEGVSAAGGDACATGAAAGEDASATGAVTIFIEGRPFVASHTDSVAAAMFAAGFEHCRTTPVSGAPRAPYCMMGVCFDCLVTIDGTGNRQACLVRVREGMRIEIQRGKREPGT